MRQSCGTRCGVRVSAPGVQSPGRRRPPQTGEARIGELEDAAQRAGCQLPQFAPKDPRLLARASDGLNGNDRVPVPASGPVNGSTPWRMSGARLCPALLSDHYRRDDATYLQLEGLSPNRIGLAWRRDRYRPVMSNFLDRRAEAGHPQGARPRGEDYAQAGAPGPSRPWGPRRLKGVR